MKGNTQNRLRIEKYISDPVQGTEKKTNQKPVKNKDRFENFKKKPKKTFTPLRIEDDIMEAFRKYCKANGLVSHGIIMNQVLKDFIIEKGYDLI